MAEAPRTLLQMAGAPSAPAPLSSAALVVIDAQHEYLDGRLPLDGIEPALDAIAALLARARRAGAPVLHVAHAGAAGGLFDRQGPGGAIVERAAPARGEAVVEKRLPNAFAGTDLQEKLRATGRDSLIIAGFMTHMCVSSTVRAALDLGWRATVVSDATATRPLPDPTGGRSLDALTLQRCSLAALADRFAVVARLEMIE